MEREKNIIGIEKLKAVAEKLGIFVSPKNYSDVPVIPEKLSKEYYKNSESNILILGIPLYKDQTPLTIVKMREHFGIDPEINEPCFYNQDWYMNEKFANQTNLEFKWYLIPKGLINISKGLTVDEYKRNENISGNLLLPSALLTAFTFFTYNLLFDETIWPNEYIWCSDFDNNHDRIYIGKYYDPKRINKNGLEIHRHLTIKNYHGLISTYC